VYLRILRCGNIVLLTAKFSDVVKITTLTPLSLLISCKLTYPFVGLKIIFPAYFRIEITQ
jgi:hypothetical protein